jgi:formate hydrogenlyase subunit 3/multisubunit Na+/H+ antiporter MnhD subunit
MSNDQLLAMLPFILLAAASIVVILMIAARLSHFAIQVMGFLMLCLVILAMWYVRGSLPQQILPLFVVDGFGALFTGVIILSVGVVGLFSYVYFEEREENPLHSIIPRNTGSRCPDYQQAFCFVISWSGNFEREPVCAYCIFAKPEQCD